MTKINTENALTAMCIWEWFMSTDHDACLSQYQSTHGACQTRDYVLEELAPEINEAYFNADGALHFHEPFDWEFIPRVMDAITADMLEPYVQRDRIHAVVNQVINAAKEKDNEQLTSR